MKKSKVRNLFLLCLLIFGFASVVMTGIFQQEASGVVAGKDREFPHFQSTSLLEDTLIIDERMVSGQGYQLINVWASWCGVCLSEHDFLVELQSQGIPIIGLNYRDKKAPAKEYLVEQGNPYTTVVFDPNGQLAIDLGVIGTPETYLVDNDGVIIKKALGRLTDKVWKDHFESYFNEG
ncbi:DsbE family thiol:disulfide interchange protein [Vibrio sp. 10N.261.55.A7]|uniref:DsbE family thiol:disulfide interchange protein n=1 Tax=Vibrio sp. 10N.261.55.A7 TaxID=1880851 RepID=UPI000C844E24|nr:DsbE family thiol:disulfide interchange protein [Vibrio sp. 10N.261.55.A7]PMJ91420.1 hypothetical protein BCU12_01090 [Vibrio sp. 10N.261.55.A7]